jgi:hypothetical protein
MIVLSDTGFHAAEGDPTNLKLCPRGEWQDRVAYLSPADNVSRPLPYRLRRLNQPVISPPNWFSIPRSTLLSSIGAHASRSLARSSTGILF